MSLHEGLSTTIVPVNGTDIIVKERQIETVIVILWISGGILLISLLILLGCILRTNKKGRRRSNPLRPGVFRVLEPSNGGVNPSYTNYDEIWTWIPVVRGDEETCPSRPETSRNVTISPAATSLASTLEPPPYSVAISTPSRPYNSPRYSSAAISTVTTSYPVSTIATTNVNINNRSSQNTIVTRSPIINSHVQRQGESESVFRSQRAQSVPLNLTSTPRQSPRMVRNVSRVVEPIDSPILRPLRSQQARSWYREVQSPLPNRRSFVETNYIGRRESEIPHSRTHRDQIGNGLIPSSVETPPFTYDPDVGVYSYVSENIGRRIWCDIPPSLMDEDGPPPYTRNPDATGSREYYQRRQRSDRPAPIVRLEYDYF